MTASWLANPHLLAVNLLNPTSLLSALGALAVLNVLFCETGLLLGFFLPGDSLLFTAGVLCATTSKSGLHLSLWATLAAGAVGALAGAQVGYLLGAKAGRPLLERSGSPRSRSAVTRAEAFLSRYGIGKALVLARFVPLVPDRHQPPRRHQRRPGADVRPLAGRGWPGVDARRHPGRIRARLIGQQHRPLPVADHRRGHRRQSHPRPAGDPARSPHSRLRVTRNPAARRTAQVPARRPDIGSR